MGTSHFSSIETSGDMIVGGNLTINGNLGNGSDFEVTGGDVDINAGENKDLTIDGGPGTATGNGKDVSITGGAGGLTSGNAGGVTITGGAPTNGDGGSISVSGSDGVGSDKDGGDVALSGGAATGAGTAGSVKINSDAILQDNKKLYLGDQNSYIFRDSEESGVVLESDGFIDILSDERVNIIASTGGFAIEEVADGEIGQNRLCKIDASGNLVQADITGTGEFEGQVVGINAEGEAVSSTDEMLLGLKGVFKAVADAKIEGGSLLKAYSGGRVGRFINKEVAEMQIISQANAGGGFTNQPANDTVTVVSSNNNDTTQVVTIYGTAISSGNEVVIEEVGLNGTTGVDTVLTDWDVILGIELDTTTLGNVTIKEKSGGQTITTISAGNTSSGILLVASENQRVFNAFPETAKDFSEKLVGLVGKSVNYSDLRTLDSVSTYPYNTIEKILAGDLETDKNLTVAVKSWDGGWATDDPEKLIGRAGPAGASGKDQECIIII